MLDLLPTSMWVVHPSPTFLEPSCGDGNFLVAVLDRKLRRVRHGYRRGTLPAGTGPEAACFHALEALASIYGVDISPDNVVGGTPGHEVGARQRVLNELWKWLTALGVPHVEAFGTMQSAAWIVDRNVLIGNMLPTGSDGRASGRDELPIHDYEWGPEDLSVRVDRTTLGAVLSSAVADVTGVTPLFGPPAPVRVWDGPALELFTPCEQPPADLAMAR